RERCEFETKVPEYLVADTKMIAKAALFGSTRGMYMRQDCSRRELLQLAVASVGAAMLLAPVRLVAEERSQTGPEGPFSLPDLPYPKDGLAPYISAETLHYHHDKHHATYVKKLNELVAGSKFADMSLEQIVKGSGDGALFNNAAQHWNHSFYWKCLSPHGGGEPSGSLADRLRKDFGTFDAFRKQFTEAAMGQFGSGWAWLVRKPDGTLVVEKTANADTPLHRGDRAILTCDVWEHAYYIDYRNERGKYVDSFWKVVNWQWAAENNA
ncbi:MAG TPA: superoxide dismutase, partial [Terriglobales bacterium]|nr:superoxide dismutase [Terriglobales bacterium]